MIGAERKKYINKNGLKFRYYRVLSKALLGFSVPDHLASMTAHYNSNPNSNRDRSPGQGVTRARKRRRLEKHPVALRDPNKVLGKTILTNIGMNV